MRCKFCNQQTVYAHSGNCCIPCNTDYYPDTKYANIRLPTIHYWDFTKPYVQFSLSTNDKFSRIVLANKILLEVDFIMNITPQNIKDKLKLYLTFS